MHNTVEKPKTVTKEKTYHIPMYKVIFHDDDETSMDFVTNVLMHVFTKSLIDANKIMREVHETGIGIAGVYPMEHAEMRRDLTIKMARRNGFDFKVTIEADN